MMLVAFFWIDVINGSSTLLIPLIKRNDDDDSAENNLNGKAKLDRTG